VGGGGFVVVVVEVPGAPMLCCCFGDVEAAPSVVVFASSGDMISPVLKSCRMLFCLWTTSVPRSSCCVLFFEFTDLHKSHVRIKIRVTSVTSPKKKV
jgi:hypothetical protein